MLEPHYLAMTGEQLDNLLAQIPGMAEQTAKIPTLEQQVADLLYEPIAVASMKCTPATAEMGQTVDAVAVAWTLNKDARTARLDGAEVSAEKAVTLNLTELGLTADKTWSLAVTDEREATASATAKLSFLNGVYYGAGAAPEGLDTSFLTKTLSSTRKRTFTVNAGAGEYIWYALPVRLGECTFKVGGFEGGFDLFAEVPFANSYGYTENYRIYRSARAGLGSTQVEVS